MTTRVLVVDESVAARQTLSELIEEQSDMCVMGTAGDPFKAVELIKKRVPDVIVLDIEMPRMDGLSFLRRIMAQRPIPVIICSTQVEEQNPVAIEALRAGAVDVAHKPKVPSRAMFEECQVGIIDKIRAAARVKMRTQSATKSPTPAATALDPQEKLTADAILPQRSLRTRNGKRKPLIAIGASTGGTQAIEALFKQLKPSVHGIVVVQHMPEHFTAAFARRLNAVSAIDVKEAENGDELRPGLALIAPGGVHLIVRPHANGYVCQTMPGPLVSRHRPSVDVLFRSVAQAAGDAALGVIMTGMGDDGARGLSEIKHTGALTLGQSQRSCVVYGMPAEAKKLGAVDKETDIDGIARVVQAFGSKGAVAQANARPNAGR